MGGMTRGEGVFSTGWEEALFSVFSISLSVFSTLPASVCFASSSIFSTSSVFSASSCSASGVSFLSSALMRLPLKRQYLQSLSYTL